METLQSTLTYAIEIVVMSFVAFVVIDVVNSVFAQAHKAYIAAHVQQIDSSLVPELLATTPSVTPEPTPTTPAQPPATEFVLTDDPWREQPAQLPDTWELPTDIQPTPILPQAVVLQFPTLKLLPQAVEVQPTPTKPKSKTTKLKSTTTKKTKPTSKAATQTPSKSRKSA